MIIVTECHFYATLSNENKSLGPKEDQMELGQKKNHFRNFKAKLHAYFHIDQYDKPWPNNLSNMKIPEKGAILFIFIDNLNLKHELCDLSDIHFIVPDGEI